MGVKAEHVEISSDIRFVMQLSRAVRIRHVETGPTQLELPGLSVQQRSVEALPLGWSAPVAFLPHVAEHVGLGRYGGPLDPKGPRKALCELRVHPAGNCIVSLPVGEPRTLFNAHRIFDPRWLPEGCPDLKLLEFTVVATGSTLLWSQGAEDFTKEAYACGLNRLCRPIQNVAAT